MVWAIKPLQSERLFEASVLNMPTLNMPILLKPFRGCHGSEFRHVHMEGLWLCLTWPCPPHLLSSSSDLSGLSSHRLLFTYCSLVLETVPSTTSLPSLNSCLSSRYLLSYQVLAHMWTGKLFFLNYNNYCVILYRL